MSIRSHIMLLVLLLGTASSASAFFSLGYRGIGALSSAPSSGLVAAIRPSPSWGLAISYNVSGLDAKEAIESDKVLANEKGNVTLTKATIDRAFVEAQLRFYPRQGSFFWSIGAISGRTKGTFDAASTIDSQSLKKDYDYQATFASISIGNIWNFGAFMLGAEWLGFTRNLSKKLTTKPANTSSTTGAVADAEGKFADFMDAYGAQGGITALLVHIGVDF